ncbi:hypothetical protein G4B88_014364 [Cannabis sativa]|uniref:Uncharacterized protein n=1 Tax=Cannabis sativa TaxID=3483 RepID=A0A7J6IA35_CANSA|nr:hypothetical protein G4B88_014364 [Cannabis sativa]
MYIFHSNGHIFPTPSNGHVGSGFSLHRLIRISWPQHYYTSLLFFFNILFTRPSFFNVFVNQISLTEPRKGKKEKEKVRESDDEDGHSWDFLFWLNFSAMVELMDISNADLGLSLLSLLRFEHKKPNFCLVLTFVEAKQRTLGRELKES